MRTISIQSEVVSNFEEHRCIDHPSYIVNVERILFVMGPVKDSISSERANRDVFVVRISFIKDQRVLVIKRYSEESAYEVYNVLFALTNGESERPRLGSKPEEV